MKQFRIGFLSIIFALVVVSLSAQVIEDPLNFSNARFTALGGSHAALADDVMTLFNNPAGFRSVEFELLISELTIRVTGPVFDITNAMVLAAGGQDLMSNPALLDLIGNLFTGIELIGPVSFAYVGSGIGVGIFNWGNMGFETIGPLAIKSYFTENLLLVGGYTFRIELPYENYIDIGASLKALLRGKTASSRSFPEFLNALLTDPGSLFMGGAFALSVGGGADAGILYSLGKILSVGVVARNAYTPTLRTPYATFSGFLGGTPALPSEYGLVPLDLSAGVKVTPPLGALDYYIGRLTLLLDYTDMLDSITHPATARNWLLHFNLGLEIVLLDVLSLRGGISEGLFSAGLGLDLGLFQLNASMFGSEESGQPATRPVYNMILGISFKL